MEKLNSSIAAIQALRSGVKGLFEHIADGVEDGREDGRQKFSMEFQGLYNGVLQQLRDVENLVGSLTVTPSAFSLGNTVYLAQECNVERQALYPQLINSFKWLDKVHEYSQLACNSLNQNNLKRSYSQKRGPKTWPSSCNISDSKDIEKIFEEMNTHTQTSYKVFRPFGSNAVVVANIGRVLKAAIVCKGLLIEWVTVKAYSEPLELDDLWTESRYEVFRKVQEHTHSAMLHFFSPTLPELAIKSYKTWLNSYSKLFLEPCKRCGKYVASGLPPTWRDLRTLEPFHEECRNC